MTTAHVCHRIAGRTRLRVPERRGDAVYFAQVHSALAGHEGVGRCDVNPATASILIEHSVSLEALAEFAVQAGLFRLGELMPAIVPGRERARQGLRRLDRELTRASNGELDLATVAGAGLLALAAVQLLRGQVLAPASTLTWYALATMHFLTPSNPAE
jgi:hypothetical protein